MSENDEIQPILGKTDQLADASSSAGLGCVKRCIVSNKNVMISIILFLMNLINVTDRYIVSSVLIDIESYFNVSKSTAGLLQTSFLLVYMAFSPLNGYLGDRMNRKYLLMASIVIWLVSTIGGSLVTSKQFYLFLLSRCLFGVATASFETICVPIIGDAFADNPKGRTATLILFNIGAPLGYGVAYLIATVSKQIKPDDWRYSMRLTPFILTFILLLIIAVYQEPSRGGSKRANLEAAINSEEPSSKAFKKQSYKNDLKVLLKNKTYVLLALCWLFGLTSLVGFSWWSASLIDYSLSLNNLSKKANNNFKKAYSISQAFGGLFGLFGSSQLSRIFKKKYSEGADCYLLSFCFFGSAVSLFTYLNVTDGSDPYLTIVVYTFLMVSYNFAWVLQAQILLDVTEPEIRSTANALIIFLLHLIGDSISPYWIGLISDHCLSSNSASRDTFNTLTHCTNLSLYPLVFISFFSSCFALFSALTFHNDKIIKEN